MLLTGIFGKKINDWGLRQAIELFDTTSHGHPDSVKINYKEYMQGIMQEFDKREPSKLRQKQLKIYPNIVRHFFDDIYNLRIIRFLKQYFAI